MKTKTIAQLRNREVCANCRHPRRMHELTACHGKRKWCGCLNFSVRKLTEARNA